MNGNWWKVLLGLAVPTLILAATWGATKLQVSDIKSEDLPALRAADKELEAADKEQSRAITDVEKDIIGIKASVEALGVQQETYHAESDRKLDTILTEVKKGNDSR